MQEDLASTDLARPVKRRKLDDEPEKPIYSIDNLLPASHDLLQLSSPPTPGIIRELDVGITEYISSDVPKIKGIIKQR
jgi:hypothetical protein